MHIEFIDLFRCPRPHGETWLVAAFTSMDDRLVREGKLGCHICGSEYAIRDGVLMFDEPAADANPRDSAAQEVRAKQSPVVAASADDIMRLAAFLGLSRPGMLALLAGRWAAMSQGISDLTSTRVLTLNAIPPGIPDTDAVGSVSIGSSIPVASRSVDGLALDESSSRSISLNEIARVLKPGGRIAAPAWFTLHGAFREIARDEANVIAESVGELVTIGR